MRHYIPVILSIRIQHHSPRRLKFRSDIPVLVSPHQGKTVTSRPCSEPHLLELETTLAAERRASTSSISSWQYKLGWIDSSTNSDSMVPHKSGYDAGYAVEHAAGVTGSTVAVGDVHSGAANCSTDSKEEVHVVGSPGITPQSGDSKGDRLEEYKLSAGSSKTNGKRFLGTRISKTSGVITSTQNAVRKNKIFFMRGSSLGLISTESGPLAA